MMNPPPSPVSPLSVPPIKPTKIPSIQHTSLCAGALDHRRGGRNELPRASSYGSLPRERLRERGRSGGATSPLGSARQRARCQPAAPRSERCQTAPEPPPYPSPVRGDAHGGGDGCFTG